MSVDLASPFEAEQNQAEARMAAERRHLLAQLAPFVERVMDGTVGRYQVVQHNPRQAREFLALCRDEVEAMLFEVARFPFQDLAAAERAAARAKEEPDIDQLIVDMQKQQRLTDDPLGGLPPPDDAASTASGSASVTSSIETLKRELRSVKASEMYLRSLASEMLSDAKAKATKIETLNGLVQRRDLLLKQQKRAYVQEMSHLREMLRQFREYGRCDISDAHLFSWDEDKLAQQQQEEVEAKVIEALAEAKTKSDQEREQLEQRHAKVVEELKRHTSLLEVQINALTVPIPKVERGCDAIEWAPKAELVETAVQTEGDVITTLDPHPPLPAPPTPLTMGGLPGIIDAQLGDDGFFSLSNARDATPPSSSPTQQQQQQSRSGGRSPAAVPEPTSLHAATAKIAPGKTAASKRPQSAKPGGKNSAAGPPSAIQSPTTRSGGGGGGGRKTSTVADDDLLRPFGGNTPIDAEGDDLLKLQQSARSNNSNSAAGAGGPAFVAAVGVMSDEQKQELVRMRAVVGQLRDELHAKDTELEELRRLRSDDRARFTKEEAAAVRKLNEELRYKSQLLDTKTHELQQLRAETERWFAAYKQTQPADSAPVNYATIRKLTVCVQAAEDAESRYRTLSWELMDTALRYDALRADQRAECLQQFKDEPTNAPALARAQYRCDALDSRARQVTARLRQSRERARQHANRCWDVVLFYARSVLHAEDPTVPPPPHYYATTGAEEPQSPPAAAATSPPRDAATAATSSATAGATSLNSPQVPLRLRAHVSRARKSQQGDAGDDDPKNWIVAPSASVNIAALQQQQQQRPGTAGSNAASMRDAASRRHIASPPPSVKFSPGMLRGLTPRQRREELVRVMRADQQQLIDERREQVHQMHANRNMLVQCATADVEVGIYKARLAGVPHAQRPSSAKPKAT